MHDIPKQLQSLTINRTMCLASLWSIERADGVILRFTDHDCSITFEGETYEPGASGVMASAREYEEGIDAKNLNVRGAITSTSITNDDLFAGKYRKARVTETVVDWRFPWAGHFTRHVYLIDETTFNGKSWAADLMSLPKLLEMSVGYNYLRTCRWREFGGSECGFNLAAVTQTGVSVSSVSTDKRVFSSGATGVDDYFNSGLVLWTTGSNTGLSFEVKSFLSASGVVSLQLETPYDIQIGDEFTISPGCDRRKETCVGYSNMLNFGGYPEIPGNDSLFLTPDAD